MSQRQNSFMRRGSFRLGGMLAYAAILFQSSAGMANPPAWWGERNVLKQGTASDDYAPLNQGQLKHLARQAVLEMRARTQGAGPVLDALIAGWSLTPENRNDYAPVNVGQLKNVARLFYDRLIELGYTDHYAWTGAAHTADDYTFANIGQAKNLFSFQFVSDSNGNQVPDWLEASKGVVDAGTDSDGDGISDAIELQFGLNPNDPADASEDSDYDGISNADEVAAGTNPWSDDTDGDRIPDSYDPHPLIGDPQTPSLSLVVPDQERYQRKEIEYRDIDYTKIALRWASSGENVTEFLIEKRVSTGSWEEAEHAGRSERKYEDTGLLANQNYYYRIRAINKGGSDEAASAPATTWYQVPFLKGLSMRTSALSRWKAGWREFYMDTPVAAPKYYLTRTWRSDHDGESSSWWDGGSSSSESSGSASSQEVLTPSEHGEYFEESFSSSDSSSSYYDDGYHSSSDSGVSAGNHSYLQRRGKTPQNLTQTSQADDEYESSSSSNWTYSNGETGGSEYSHGYNDTYLLQGTFQPATLPPFWTGNDYDMSLGEVVWSGDSARHDRLSGPSYHSSYDAASTPNPAGQGQWSGNWNSVSTSHGVSTNDSGQLNYPACNPWRRGYGSNWAWGSNPEATPTRIDYHYDSESTHESSRSTTTDTASDELSNEYETDAFIADTVNDLPDWPLNFWDNYYGWGSYPWGWYNYWDYAWYGWWQAGRNLSPSEESFWIRKAQYQFQASPSVPYQLKWYEIFVPEDNAATTEVDESQKQKVVKSYAKTAGPEPQSFPEEPAEIDPSQRNDGDGNYYIAFSPTLDGYGDNGVWLDPAEKTTSGLALVERTISPDAGSEEGAEGGESAEPTVIYENTFWLSKAGVAMSKYTFSWTDDAITLVLTGAYNSAGKWSERPIENGETLTWDELRNSTMAFEFRIEPEKLTPASISSIEKVAAAGTGTNGATILRVTLASTVKVTATDKDNNSLGEDSIRGHLLLPFELSSDLNNNGKIDSADSQLKTDGAKTDATDEAKEKATEYLFVNDDLSNGLWDKDDEDAPEDATEDDDAQEIKTVCAATWGAIWFEHPIIEKLAFYKTKECNAADKLTFPFALSATDKLPEKLYVRAEEVTVQVEGDLVMKFGKADKTETWAEDKLKFTVVKELGDKKYFHAARDYILENNTRLFVHEKKYPASSPSTTFRFCVMREEATSLWPIETFYRTPQIAGIDSVAASYPMTVILNGNQVSFKDGTGAWAAAFIGALGTLGIGEGKLMTDTCHGRIKESSAATFSLASSDIFDTAATPMAGSPLAGPDPGTTNPGGKYVAQKSDKKWTFGAGMVPDNLTQPPFINAALGGLSTYYDNPIRDTEPQQFVGYAPLDGQGKGCVFTATQISGGGRGELLAEDAKKSGVPALPGGSKSTDLSLLILDSGDTSVVLAHIDPGETLKVVDKGAKQNGVPYFVNTFLGFYSEPPRQP
jgi:hypothetical protein